MTHRLVTQIKEINSGEVFFKLKYLKREFSEHPTEVESITFKDISWTL